MSWILMVAFALCTHDRGEGGNLPSKDTRKSLRGLRDNIAKHAHGVSGSVELTSAKNVSGNVLTSSFPPTTKSRS